MRPEEEKTAQAPLFNRNFGAATLANISNSLSMQMLVATLPVYVVSMGGSHAVAGFVSGILSLTAVFFRPLAGRLVDKGWRRNQVVFGCACYATASVIYLFARSIPALVLGRLIHGLGLSSYVTASYAYVVAIAPARRRAEALGIYSTAYAFALIIGPVIGFLLIAGGRFTRMFYFTTVLYCAALAVILLATEQRQASEIKLPPWSLRTGLISVEALPVAWLMLCMGIGLGALTTFIALFAKSRGVQNPGYYFMVEASAVLISRVLTGKLADRHGRYAVLLPGMLSMVASLLLLPWCRDLWSLAISAVLFGYGFGSSQPAAMALLIDQVPQQRRGIALSTIYTGFDGGIALGSMLLGLASQRWGFGALWPMAAACTLLGLLGLLRAGGKRARAA